LRNANLFMKFLSTFFVAWTLSARILVCLLAYLPQEVHRFQPSAPTLKTRLSLDTEPELEPEPPCGKEPLPAYPRLNDPAVVKSWGGRGLGRDWKPPACIGWTEVGFTALVTTAARFDYVSGAQGLLQRLGAISQLAGVRYWSTTHKQWRTLIVEARALRAPQSGQLRKDFTPDEMKEGSVLYFEQVDSLSGRAIYRMHIAKSAADRLVVDVENVSTMRYRLVPILRPAEIQSVYFLDRESDDVWRYYGIMRTGKSANRFLLGNEASAVNRAAAFYRYLVGIPTDQEPPAAR
jgi:hypothetical protein